MMTALLMLNSKAGSLFSGLMMTAAIGRTFGNGLLRNSGLGHIDRPSLTSDLRPIAIRQRG